MKFAIQKKQINNSLCFYNITHKAIKSSLNNINKKNNNFEWLIMINKDLLLIPGENKITIINTNKYSIVKIIDPSGSGWICNICVLNENILLTGDRNENIKEWKIEGDNLILISQKEKAHNNYINYLINIGNCHITSASRDKTIKIW